MFNAFYVELRLLSIATTVPTKLIGENEMTEKLRILILLEATFGGYAQAYLGYL